MTADDKSLAALVAVPKIMLERCAHHLGLSADADASHAGRRTETVRLEIVLTGAAGPRMDGGVTAYLRTREQVDVDDPSRSL